jgi:succinate dehydrogenase / fumarate reductase membrane anchor subunit
MRLLTGLRAWVAQRASAVFMLGFLVWLAGLLLLSPPDGYEQWRVLVARPAVSVAFAGFFVALLIHAWVGARDVVLDYVHNPGARATALVLVGAALAATGAWLGLTLAALHVR